ncbi:MAG: FAD-dependent oxidoreductase [Candidatus Lokiarchaeota archaeon]|nr:FAD-dependent oxidoreductase [Candidatus Lokiarchaeota archaeon]
MDILPDKAKDAGFGTKKDVIIVGGGLSGLTAAYLLAPDFNVTVLEAEDTPGGQARAFRIDGKTVEHGSHAFFGYYKNSLELLERLGGGDNLMRVPGWTIVNESGQKAFLTQSRFLPGLFRLVPSLMRIPWLSIGDRFRAMRAAYRIIKAPFEKYKMADQKTALELGTDVGYSKEGILTWNSASLGLTNLFVTEQSGAIFAGKHKVLVGTRRGLSYKLPSMNLSELFTEPLSRAVQSRGGTIRFKHRVTEIGKYEGDPNGHTSRVDVEHDGTVDSAHAHHVIVAVQPQDAALLAPWVEAPWTGLKRVNPIITMTLGLSGRIGGSPDGREYGFSRADWVFSVVTDLSRFWPEFAGPKTVLRVEIGHADLLPGGIDTPDEEIGGLVKKDLDRFWPECQPMRVEFAKIHREKRHLYVSWTRGEFVKKPENGDRRLGNHVYLAGDWTTRGTIGMEAAVNSAYEAANFVRSAEGLAPIPFEDVPV